MPDLVSRSVSLASIAWRDSAGMMLAWSTTRPVSAGKLAANAAASNIRTDNARQAPVRDRARDRGRRGDVAPIRPLRSVAQDQNFTCGGFCASSFAWNSAIGLLDRKKVAAH